MFNIRLILLGLAALALAFLVWDYTHLKSENQRLNNELQTANSTIEALDRKVKAEMSIIKKEAPIIKEIQNAPATEDGPVAPVLRQAIDRL